MREKNQKVSFFSFFTKDLASYKLFLSISYYFGNYLSEKLVIANIISFYKILKSLCENPFQVFARFLAFVGVLAQRHQQKLLFYQTNNCLLFALFLLITLDNLKFI
ncbi:hypothetical protein Fleli_1766 [Bernardetia litoralis DSM 6794]|uniref:Uncharacterized protein n=1 Tax=Bernardetia litoralis (strain ATCC 23117 / DSM 6794 / NBRC 15988 / NCIMB 1366 / Fx l1 / Sio-4) TaxID=880071 RepID=I4AJN0_BERLS|nr:hypothetical protein Fleli_1766 [Bernardetia litoralis DSM 6794]